MEERVELWNPESWALESRIRLKESDVPLTTGIWNPSSPVINPKPSTWNSESTAWNPQSKTVLDFLTWGNLSITNSSTYLEDTTLHTPAFIGIVFLVPLMLRGFDVVELSKWNWKKRHHKLPSTTFKSLKNCSNKLNQTWKCLTLALFRLFIQLQLGLVLEKLTQLCSEHDITFDLQLTLHE